MADVLVVEDEELIRTMIKMNLEKEGYQVTTCVDAESMLDTLYSGTCFDLILLDLMLPVLQGQKALQSIRDKNINIPVIVVSAKNDMDSKLKAFETGADDYITKPFNMKELLMRVRVVMRRFHSPSGGREPF